MNKQGTVIYIYCLSYTTHSCKVRIMQLTPKLHVSTPWGHLQAYKICVVQGTFVNATYGIPWFTVH